MSRKTLFAIMAITVLVFILPKKNFAQLDNRPFSFSYSPQGGVGMSNAGREAILNQQLFGLTPKNLYRDQNGALLDIMKAPGDLATVRSPVTGDIISGYHGPTLADQNPMMTAGAFNNFFVPGAETNACCAFQDTPNSTVSTWTSRVISNDPSMLYNNAGLVDTWTAQASLLK